MTTTEETTTTTEETTTTTTPSTTTTTTQGGLVIPGITIPGFGQNYDGTDTPAPLNSKKGD